MLLDVVGVAAFTTGVVKKESGGRASTANSWMVMSLSDFLERSVVGMTFGIFVIEAKPCFPGNRMDCFPSQPTMEMRARAGPVVLSNVGAAVCEVSSSAVVVVVVVADAVGFVVVVVASSSSLSMC